MESNSLKFKFIERHLIQLFSAITQNQNIAKYVYYSNSNNPLSLQDVTVDLQEEGYYHLDFFDSEVSEDEKVRLFLNLIGSPMSEPVDNITYLIEVVVPKNSCILSGRGEIRGIRILDEVAKMIDQKLGIGIGETKMRNLRVSKVTGKNYNVYSAQIILSNPTIKG